MFFRTTISLCDSSNPVDSTASGSSNSPENNSAYISAIRSGVLTSPSRELSSPTASMISRTALTMRSWSIPAVGALILRDLPGRASIVAEVVNRDFTARLDSDSLKFENQPAATLDWRENVGKLRNLFRPCGRILGASLSAQLAVL